MVFRNVFRITTIYQLPVMNSRRDSEVHLLSGDFSYSINKGRYKPEKNVRNIFGENKIHFNEHKLFSGGNVLIQHYQL